MNGKKANMLRHDARNASIGWPEVDYDFIAVNKVYLDQFGKQRQFQMIRWKMKRKCTRALYKALKIIYMNQQRAGLNG